ncbi:DUF3536 domain-containing protein [Sediminispirochaeta bajacaliforniensis]|uniref:DUF3536 domain-containing protein n=1 Tax=Sediminispirochaeta bajacaliforniensis TaxID=148 RepID=UPI0003A4016D|nr:DUF3536 domain-containing protein [Sediminispirochaeta bajacaliforniensis]
MKTQLILHGHFYQPPRMNPWTGIVPVQRSAAPYHDWNSRITRECYAANAYSRYLRYDGRIDDIINNYEMLSFNIGPTLLGWLQEKAPNVYGRIIDADRKSRERLGHGNALAQGYNHTILPLDDPEDAEIQIRWGIEDFKHHFGRAPEGMWLPECGVNDTVINLLIAEGISFIILAPWQGEAIRQSPSDTWLELGKESVPYYRSYRIQGEEGSISAFFYNAELSGGISFNHYLRSADTLYSRILKIKSENEHLQLIHAATDGEVYGHHEPFGDMCLAALSKLIRAGEEFEFTNYATYLELNPPTWEVRLRKGEEHLGTSWSCVHGVSRWYKDCGCKTGGKADWDQRWRSPLRKGLTLLSHKLKAFRNHQLSALSSLPPEKIVKEYAAILCSRRDPLSFAQRVGIATDTESITKMLTILEGEKLRHFMFTSCAWFFSDISGIETLQNLSYALRAIELAQELGETEELYTLLKTELSYAISNLPDHRNGGEILDDLTDGILPGELEPALFFHMNRLLHREKSDELRYGIYRLESLLLSEEKTRKTSHAKVVNTITGQHYLCTVTTHIRPNEPMDIHAEDQYGRKISIGNDRAAHLPEQLRYALSDLLIASSQRLCGKAGGELVGPTTHVLNWARTLRLPISPDVLKSAEVAVDWRLQHIMPLPHRKLSAADRRELAELLDFAVNNKLEFDRKEASRRFTYYLSQRFSTLSPQLTMQEAREIIELHALAARAQIEEDITIAQNIIFDQLKIWREKIVQVESLTPSKRDQEAMAPILSLCEGFGIYADDMRRKKGEKQEEEKNTFRPNN